MILRGWPKPAPWINKRTLRQKYVWTDIRTYRFPLCSTGLRPPSGPKPKKRNPGGVLGESKIKREKRKMMLGATDV